MLYVNGYSLESYAEDSWVKKLFNDVVERLEQAKVGQDFAVKFRIKESKITSLRTDKGRIINVTPDEFINYKQTVTEKDDKGRTKRVQYVYSEDPLPEENGKVDTTGAKLGKWMYRQNTAEETVKDVELAFFLYHVHKKFGEKEDGRTYYLVDARSEATKKIEGESKNVKYKYILYADDGPLRQDEQKLRTIAQAWGVEDVMTKDPEVIVTELDQKVQEGEQHKKEGSDNARGIKEFIEDSKLGYMTQVMAIVQQAVDQNILGVELAKPNQLGVYYLDSNGGLAKKIIGLTPKSLDAWKVRAAQYLASPGNEGQLNAIKVELGIATEEEEQNAGEEIDPYEILDNFYADEYKTKVKEICKSYDIRIPGRKKEDWRADLIKVWKDMGWLPEDYEE